MILQMKQKSKFLKIGLCTYNSLDTTPLNFHQNVPGGGGWEFQKWMTYSKFSTGVVWNSNGVTHPNTYLELLGEDKWFSFDEMFIKNANA